MADEKIRWAESVAVFDQMLCDVIGDITTAAGCVAYLGAFTVSLCVHTCVHVHVYMYINMDVHTCVFVLFCHFSYYCNLIIV